MKIINSKPIAGYKWEENLLRRLPFAPQLDRLEAWVVTWLARNSFILLRVALGIIFFWFGALKLSPNLSPAESLVRHTMYFVNLDFFIPFLAIWEMAIGLGLIFGVFMRVTLFLLFAQMLGTLLPFLVVPQECFITFPYGLSMEGQYIVKNLVLISSGLVLGSTVRGGYWVVADMDFL